MTVTVSGESEADWDGHFGVKGVLFGVSVVIRRLGVIKEPRLMMSTWMSKLLRLIDGSEERVESKSMLPFKYSTYLKSRHRLRDSLIALGLLTDG